MNDLLIIVGIVLVVYILLRVYSANQRKKAILAYKDQWGEDVCRMVLNKKLGTGMTKEMVQLSWGKPKKIDQREVTANSERVRWVYGQPRKNAQYVYFKDGRVIKIQT